MALLWDAEASKTLVLDAEVFGEPAAAQIDVSLSSMCPKNSNVRSPTRQDLY